MTKKPGDDSFAGKVVVITGAGSGIGRALAVNLAGRGAKLAISDINGADVEATALRCEAMGVEVKVDRLDITEREDVASYAGGVRAHFGTVNQIYNNAGITYYGTVERELFKDMERVLDVNFWGAVNITKAFLPHLIDSGDGHVVTISSLFGLITFPGQSAYNASKFAIRGFTEALRQEMLVAKHPVRVTCVHPGGIKTGVARNATVVDGLDPVSFANTFDKRLALHTPEMAAETITEGVRRHRARVVVGAEAKALDWLVRIAPVGSQRFGAWFSRFFAVAPRPETT
ncbi:SDR family oxidoreductase [Umezawaea sp. Da 62-37]|uniref:SDR family NAD(P)-dependent oxidoreductase n=1 Tax=Umezawaea sp. Da 62-37 TaxID=3075927 RepID=UPI0028F6C55C|nr:SDR family oxidoreductase [Umezawaea sp. Da 62-37]WNV85263.1 SDR family oxidoreductase [Umezawaea sp. Da 62-37]